MRLLALSICLLATVIITNGNTIANLALHGSKLSPEEVQQCYESTNLQEDELITYGEIKNGTYSQNTEKAKKNGCFSACILEKRKLIVDGEIQKNKLYGEQAHANLHHDVRGAIYMAVDRCVEEVKTNPDLCEKSLSLLVCLSKNFI